MNQKQYITSFIGILLAALTATVGFLTVMAADQAVIFSPETDIEAVDGVAATAATTANCRYGVTPLGNDQYPLVDDLGAGWILNFAANPSVPATDNNAVYVPSIRLKEVNLTDQSTTDWYLFSNLSLTGAAAKTHVQNLVAGMPTNTLWLIGNEIERIGQDAITPATYARAYHDIYHWIKEVDPTAQVAISGLVEVTPLRLVYLDMVWNAYLAAYGTAMPVDVWNMHLYIIPEVAADGVTPDAASIPVGVSLAQTTAVPKRASSGSPTFCSDTNIYCTAEHDSMAIFIEQVTMMRQWMKDKGQQQKPLIISEFSILWPYVDTTGDGNPDFLRDEFGNLFTPARVSTFMTNAFNYLESANSASLGYALDGNRLVQQWMWFAIHAPWTNGDYDNWQNALPGQASDLYFPQNPPSNMTLVETPVGATFRNYVTSRATVPNLLIDKVQPGITAPVTPTTTVTATVQVTVRNVGNTAVSTPFTVGLYQGNTLVGSTVVNAPVGGCGVYPTTVTIEWPIEVTSSASSVLPVTVRVDTTGAISESNEADNAAATVVIVNAESLYLPLIVR